MRYVIWSILFVTLVAVACEEQAATPGEPTPTPTATPEASPTPAPTATPVPKLAWSGKHADADLWTKFVQLELMDTSLPLTIPTDMDSVCPKYEGLSESDRTLVFAHLISKMTQYESNFKPETFYQEAFRDAKGQLITSRGLLQLSIESANGYGCGIAKQEDLHDPYVNLSCGVRILERWVSVKDKVVKGYNGTSHLGAGRYWAVMRQTNAAQAKILAYMKELPLCK